MLSLCERTETKVLTNCCLCGMNPAKLTSLPHCVWVLPELHQLMLPSGWHDPGRCSNTNCSIPKAKKNSDFSSNKSWTYVIQYLICLASKPWHSFRMFGCYMQFWKSEFFSASLFLSPLPITLKVHSSDLRRKPLVEDANTGLNMQVIGDLL